MLPFLKRKQDSVANLIIKQREPDKDKDSKDLEDYSLEDCAQRLIEAVHSSDKFKVVDALREIVRELKSEPHEQVNSMEPHSYEAQNQLAAKKE